MLFPATVAEGERECPIPCRGLGTFQPDPTVPQGSVKAAVVAALKIGYRHIDTALAYGAGQVEREVGEALHESGIPREDVFVVTKLHNTFHEPKDVKVGLEQSLQNLRLDYVDLYLMHNPYAYAHDSNYDTIRRTDGSGRPLIDIQQSKEYPETWRAMSALVMAGKAKFIGVSNFNILKLKRLIEETGIIPAVNQVEFNPYFPQFALLDYCKEHNIKLVAHCPLGGALAPQVAARKGAGPLDDPVIKGIARNHGRSPSQVILSWIIQQGVSVIPKSNSVSRIAENFDVLFKLTEKEDTMMRELMGPRGERAVRNLVSTAHIGFDVYDEMEDQPVEGSRKTSTTPSV